MPRKRWKQSARRLPTLCLLAAAVVAATAFRPPPGDRTDCLYEAEISACTRVIESGKLKGPALAKIYWHRAAAFEREEEYARAVADYTEAIRLDPKDDGAPHRLALVYEKLGKYAQAETLSLIHI